MQTSQPNIRVVIAVLALMGLSGCTQLAPSSEKSFMYKDLPVAHGTAMAGEGHTVSFKGTSLDLEGPGIKVGDQLRPVQVTKGDLSLVNLADTKGRVRIISIVPSLDTKVCEQQTHYLSEKNNGLDQSVDLITVSVDTPFAQTRFAEEASIANVTFLSDYRSGAFGRTYGLLVPKLHILARTVMVVDTDNVIRFMQITPELAQMPDMEEAFKAARSLINKGMASLNAGIRENG